MPGEDPIKLFLSYVFLFICHKDSKTLSFKRQLSVFESSRLLSAERTAHATDHFFPLFLKDFRTEKGTGLAPDVGVFGHRPQADLFSHRCHHQRNLVLRRWHQLGEVDQRSAEAVDFINDYDVDPSRFDIGEKTF